MPNTISTLIITSDLQGVIRQGNDEMLLGEYLADHLKLFFDVYFPSINRENVLLLLCGDLYTNLIKRGESGDPINVWRKFSAVFGLVVGIAGNHDHFDGIPEKEINNIGNAIFISNGIITINGLKIGGLSGITGRPDKNFRMHEQDYLKALSAILKKQPDILLTHLSPCITSKKLQGDQNLTNVLHQNDSTVLFCGHSHWPINQHYVLDNGTQVLNADTKVFILFNQ